MEHLWAQTGTFYFNFLFLFVDVCFGLLMLLSGEILRQKLCELLIDLFIGEL
jgi:hypothetical protein